MKRFCQNLAVVCALLWLACGCSTGEFDRPDTDTEPDTGTGYVVKPPVFLGCEVISGTEIDFEFSAPVKILSLSFDPGLDVGLIEEGSTVKVHLEKSFRPGSICSVWPHM